MVICPIAVAVGCKRCPAFAVCPLKTVIGDYKPDAKSEPAPARAKSAKAHAAAKPKQGNRKGARARRPRK